MLSDLSPSDAVAAVFMAVLGRAPEYEAMAYFSDRYSALQTDHGKDGLGHLVAEIQAAAVVSEEINDSAEQQLAIVRGLYANLLGRDADPAGEAYWARALAEGSLSVDSIVVAFLSAVLEPANDDGAALANRTAVAKAFALEVNSGPSVLGALTVNAAQILAGVNADPGSVDAATGKLIVPPVVVAPEPPVSPEPPVPPESPVEPPIVPEPPASSTRTFDLGQDVVRTVDLAGSAVTAVTYGGQAGSELHLRNVGGLDSVTLTRERSWDPETRPSLLSLSGSTAQELAVKSTSEGMATLAVGRALNAGTLDIARFSGLFDITLSDAPELSLASHARVVEIVPSGTSRLDLNASHTAPMSVETLRVVGNYSFMTSLTLENVHVGRDGIFTMLDASEYGSDLSVSLSIDPEADHAWQVQLSTLLRSSPQRLEILSAQGEAAAWLRPGVNISTGPAWYGDGEEPGQWSTLAMHSKTLTAWAEQQANLESGHASVTGFRQLAITDELADGARVNVVSLFGSHFPGVRLEKAAVEGANVTVEMEAADAWLSLEDMSQAFAVEMQRLGGERFESLGLSVETGVNHAVQINVTAATDSLTLDMGASWSAFLNLNNFEGLTEFKLSASPWNTFYLDVGTQDSLRVLDLTYVRGGMWSGQDDPRRLDVDAMKHDGDLLVDLTYSGGVDYWSSLDKSGSDTFVLRAFDAHSESMSLTEHHNHFYNLSSGDTFMLEFGSTSVDDFARDALELEGNLAQKLDEAWEVLGPVQAGWFEHDDATYLVARGADDHGPDVYHLDGSIVVRLDGHYDLSSATLGFLDDGPGLVMDDWAGGVLSLTLH